MKKIIAFFAVAAAFSAFVSCAKTEGRPDEDKVSCDTISYKKHIVPLVEANCAKSGCHTESAKMGGVVFPAMLKEQADKGRIRKRVIEGDPSFMPADKGKLPAKEYNMVKCWLDNGAPVN